jgi:hypothetical protein
MPGVHVHCGTGRLAVVLAERVGPTGSVDGIDHDRATAVAEMYRVSAPGTSLTENFRSAVVGGGPGFITFGRRNHRAGPRTHRLCRFH